MPTVRELSAPYANHLLPVLPAGPGVCSICHTSVVWDWERCYKCNEAIRSLPTTADAVSFVALAVKGEQLARELWVYKGERIEARQRPQFGLSAVLWSWLVNHEDCLVAGVGVGSFDVVTTIPSTIGRLNHPLEGMIGEIVRPTAERYRALLRHRPDDAGDRHFGVDRFEAIEVEDGASILLIDDTWTSGSRTQSAAAALKVAGAGPVGVLAIGRHFNRDPGETAYKDACATYYKRAKAMGWSWTSCCLEASNAPN
jgi:hypothetical protein